MTSKERMRTAMAMGTPDRVPVMCQMSIGHMLLQTGCPPAQFWLSKDRFVDGLLRLRERYGFDGILVSLHGHAPDWEKQVVRRASDDDGETIFWKDGGRTVFPWDDLPHHEPAVPLRPALIADFDPASVPARLDYIPVSQGLSFSVDPDHPYDAFYDVLAAAGSAYSIHGEVTSPFDYFLDLFGFAGGFLALVEAPRKSKDILQRFAEGVAALGRDQARLGLDAVKISSPYAGAGFISPAFYREFVLPYERQVARAVRDAGAAAYIHTCGAVRDRLEMVAEAGVSGIECLDPPPLGNVGLADAKARVGGRIFLKGNIDPVNTLLFGSPERIAEDVRRCLEEGMPGGGYILSTACSIAPRTRRENVECLGEIADVDGRYGS